MQMNSVSLDEVVVLRRANPAWRLLASDNAAAVCVFIDRAFLETGARAVPEAVLADVLADVVDEVNAADPDSMPRDPRDYLGDWCGDGFGWLRRYYPAGNDEPVYDLLPAAESAVVWAKGLARSRSFIGTESRLLQVVSLLDQIIEGSQADPDERIRMLEERRADIDAQIEAIRSGEVLTLGAAALRDRYQTLSSTARGLLGDFRAVEEDFRGLDRQTRERIAQWDGPRGALLDEVLGRRNFITSGETGASFSGFYDFLFDPGRWERFQSLLRAVAEMPEVAGVDDGLPAIARDWLAGAEAVQRTIARLSGQMRRFLEEQGYAENRRIGALVHRIEANAVRVRDYQPSRPDFMELVEPRGDISLPMDRTMFDPPVKLRFDDPSVAAAPSDEQVEAMVELFAWQRIDKARVREVIAETLRDYGGGLSLADLLVLAPLSEGLAELVTVLEVAQEQEWMVEVDQGAVDVVEWREPDRGRVRVARVPRVILDDVNRERDDDVY